MKLLKKAGGDRNYNAVLFSNRNYAHYYHLAEAFNKKTNVNKIKQLIRNKSVISRQAILIKTAIIKHSLISLMLYMHARY